MLLFFVIHQKPPLDFFYPFAHTANNQRSYSMTRQSFLMFNCNLSTSKLIKAIKSIGKLYPHLVDDIKLQISRPSQRVMEHENVIVCKANFYCFINFLLLLPWKNAGDFNEFFYC